jgi:hypothetical protein
MFLSHINNDSVNFKLLGKHYNFMLFVLFKNYFIHYIKSNVNELLVPYST